MGSHFLLQAAASIAAKSLQSCPTLCNPIDYSPPGYPVPGILQERTLECVAISFSNAWKSKVNVKSLSRVWLLATPQTAAYQAPLPMQFSRQEYGNGVPLPSPHSPGDIPNPRTEPRSPALQADSLQSETAGKPHLYDIYTHIQIYLNHCAVYLKLTEYC